MYSAVDNPFHDANLGEQFQWHKKREKEKKAGLTTEEIARKDAKRRIEAKEELEKLNKKRAEREVQMQLREEEEARMRVLAEDAAMAEWHAKEGSFQLEQSRRRAGIRLRMKRGKAIDFLAINLRFADAQALGRTTSAIGALTNNPHRAEIEREEEEEGWGWADAGFEFEIDEPWKIFDVGSLKRAALTGTESHTGRHGRARGGHQDVCFPRGVAGQHRVLGGELREQGGVMLTKQAMQVVCQYHLEQLRDPDHAIGGRLYNKDVDESAGKIVSGLSLQRLNELETKTHNMLNSGQPVDGEFWDLVLKKIHVEKAIVSCDDGRRSNTCRPSSTRSTRLFCGTALSSSRSDSAKMPHVFRPSLVALLLARPRPRPAHLAVTCTPREWRQRTTRTAMKTTTWRNTLVT